MLEAV